MWSSDLTVEMILKLRDVEMRRAIGPVKEVLLRLHDLSHRIGAWRREVGSVHLGISVPILHGQVCHRGIHPPP